MRIIQDRLYYRFELTYCLWDTLGTCLIEIMVLGPKPKQPTNPVVVMTQRKSDPLAPGIVNAVEQICSLVRAEFLEQLNIDPNHATWIQHWEAGSHGKSEWSRMEFEGRKRPIGVLAKARAWGKRVFAAMKAEVVKDLPVHPDYDGPMWRESAPVMFDWDALPERTYWVTQRKVVTMNELQLEHFGFDRGDCHRMATGTCSLDPGAQPDEHIGRNGYGYCRRLAVLAQVWDLVRTYFGGDIPLKSREREALTAPEVIQYVCSHWDSRFGQLSDDLESEISQAVWCFGASDRGHAIVASVVDDKLSFNDGRHRSCVACRLEIPIAAFITTEREPATVGNKA